MANQARITSIEALEAFRNKLIIYLSKARPTMEEVTAEISRTRNWLQNDRRMYWENELRKRRKKLEDAKQALYTARTANLRDVTTAEQQAVRVAERAVQHAEEKLKIVKKWMRDFDALVLPMGRPLEKLTTVLVNVLPDGVLYLGKSVENLQAYSGTNPSRLSEEPPPPPATTPAAGKPNEGKTSETTTKP
jgi:hypothetical protein